MASQTRPTNTLKPDPKQPRKVFDEQELDRLGDDMLARGVLQELLITPDGIIIDGERRKRAADRKGIKELPVKVIDKPLSDKDLRGIQLATVFHKVGLKGYEQWMTCSELMCMNPEWEMKNLAEFLHLDPSMVTRILSPCRCIPAVQEALKQDKIGISACYAISKLPESEQAGLLALKLSGASRDQIEQAGRHKRNGKPDGEPPQRTGRIKIQLAINTKEISVNGMATVAALPGKEISLQEAENILTQAAKAVREAIKQGLDAKTLERVCRDKAKRGGA